MSDEAFRKTHWDLLMASFDEQREAARARAEVDSEGHVMPRPTGKPGEIFYYDPRGGRPQWGTENPFGVAAERQRAYLKAMQVVPDAEAQITAARELYVVGRIEVDEFERRVGAAMGLNV